MTGQGWARLLEAGRAELARLRLAMADPRGSQLTLLGDILAANASSGFGREHGFRRIAGLADYRASVPIYDYQAYLPWIVRIDDSELDALTSDPAFVFEETGGSSGGRKLVPYSGAALAGFRAAVLAWLADLVEADPAIADGRAYFAISPAARAPRKSAGGLPIGLESDAAYLGPELASSLGALLVGTDMAGVRDIDAWRQSTLRDLVRARDLSLISVWSPTFLTGLLEALETDAARIASDIREGEAGDADPARANELLACVINGRLDVSRLWPKLRLVSAWADGSSVGHARRLRERLGDAPLQPKGLLATEGAFTLPLSGAAAPLPALTSAFLEFEDESGGLWLVDELTEGLSYQLIVTTPGGLYRYRIGDRVRCGGFWRGHGKPVPMLSFAGRAGGTIDLVGEKLDEAFIAESLSRLNGFAALVADNAQQPGYVLLTDVADGGLKQAAEHVERMLGRNMQYLYARRVGQLAALRAVKTGNALERYTAWRLRRGDRLGDIKPPVAFASMDAVAAFWPEVAARLAPVHDILEHGSAGNSDA